MSPKTFKNKKESKDSKRPDSKIESGSASFSKLDEVPNFPDFHDDDPNLKSAPDLNQDEMEDLPIPLYQDSEVDEDNDSINSDEKCRATDYFDKFAKAIIKVFDVEGQVVVFPMLVKKLLDKKGYFKPISSISAIICEMIDAELDRKGFLPFFLGSIEYEHGFACDLQVESYDKNLGSEFYLNDKNYLDMLFSTYLEMKVVNLHVHVKGKLLRSMADCNTDYQTIQEQIPVMNYATRNVKSEGTNVEEKYLQAPMFRGRPIDMSPGKVDLKTEGHSTPTLKNPSRHFTTSPVPGSKYSDMKAPSPICILEDDDYLVKLTDQIIPFGQQSVQGRIMDLQVAATANVPDVSTFPKLLKSHNVGYKEGDNAATWYARFNNFCLMLGIYLPPPNAMKKDSEMGVEWDSQALPFVFYSRFSKMEKVLSHILFAPEFFPKYMQDELQLNPKPYNFLRLFMAIHSNSVPDLSDRVIKRPGPMNHSQSLAQYALAWVNYFVDESNVNGVQYSKFR
jgi:hypothetical protein